MADEQKANFQQAQQQATGSRGSKRSGKGSQPKIGGTALPGAKSTQPKPSPASVQDPNQQQMLSYNRDMRRRMQNLGTGPAGQDEQMEKMRHKRDKRIERRKQRQDERRQQALKAVPRSSIGLNLKNFLFPIIVVAVIVLLIALFVVLRLTHVVG